MSSEKTFTSPFGCVGGCPHCVELCRRIRRAVVSEQTQDLARGIRGAWDPIGDVQSHLMELSRRVDALEATLPRAKARELNEAIQESEPECTCYEYHGGHQPGCPMAPMPAPAPPVKSRGMEVAEICRTARGKINDLHYAAKIGGDVCQQRWSLTRTPPSTPRRRGAGGWWRT